MATTYILTIALTITSFFTAILSSITGMGGGVTLFSVMTFFMPLDLILPIHGMTQLTSNSSRVFYFKKFLNVKIFTRFAIGAVIGTVLAVYLKEHFVIDKKIPLSIVAFLIFYTVLKPKKMPSLEVNMNGFLFVGFFVGLLAIFVGAIGPFLAVFYVRDDLSKEEVIANKALMQLFIHTLKIPAFLFLGFNYFTSWYLWIPLCVASVYGSKYGLYLLGKVKEEMFRFLFKSALLIAGVNIIYKVIMDKI